MIRRIFLLACVPVVAACAGTATAPGQAASSGFNPSQLAKTDIDRVAEAHQREIFVNLKLLTEKLYRRNPREDFQGDRVLAFVAGLGGMIQTAFHDKTEFFILDDLEPQGLYNAARNVEIAVWKLSNARNARGELLLLSNEGAGTVRNLSFEREFGKVIAGLDVLSKIVADKDNRTVVRIIQSLATAVFLPVK
jgi:hypothetical protein